LLLSEMNERVIYTIACNIILSRSIYVTKNIVFLYVINLYKLQN